MSLYTTTPFSLLLLFATLTVCGFSHAAEARMFSNVPFAAADMNPLTMNYGAPWVSMPARLPSGALELSFGVDLANSLHSELTSAAIDSEYLSFDYELTRLGLALAYGLSADWDLRVELPLYSYSGGMLDSFVDNYHQRFGFAEGARPDYPRNNLEFRYRRDKQYLLDIHNAASGIGDIKFMAVRNISSEYEDALSYGFALKAPLGNYHQLLGSGTFDLAMWITSTNNINQYFSHYMGIGGVLLQPDTGLLHAMRRPGFGIANYGLVLHATRAIDLRMEFNWRSAIYKTDSKILGNSSTLNVGGTIAMTHGYQLDLGISEDIVVGSAPDFNLHLQISKRFGGVE